MVRLEGGGVKGGWGGGGSRDGKYGRFCESVWMGGWMDGVEAGTARGMIYLIK